MRGDTLDTSTPLDVRELRRQGWQEWLLSQLRRRWVYAVAQTVCPSVRVGGFVLATRFDDVQDILENDRVFEVEGLRIERGNRGLGFLLGMQDDPHCPFDVLRRAGPARKKPALSYREYQDLVMRYFPLRDLAQVASWSERAAEHAIEVASARSKRARLTEIDAIQRLITHVPLELCRQYYGVEIPDGPELTRWTCVISRWLFDPAPSSRFDQLGAAACGRLNRLIDGSIEQLRAGASPAGDTIIERMLRDGVDSAVIRVIVFGMILGFVPTNTMAGGHILQMLLQHPEYLVAASAAAAEPSDHALKRCLFEAMRFKPLLRDPLRICRAPYKLSDGWLRGVRCEPGERVIALVSSALMDARRVRDPARFDSQRTGAGDLLFGCGMHRCIGAPIAEVQLVRTLKPLLRKRGLCAAAGAKGRLQTLGPFPEHLFVQFDASE